TDIRLALLLIAEVEILALHLDGEVILEGSKETALGGERKIAVVVRAYIEAEQREPRIAESRQARIHHLLRFGFGERLGQAGNLALDSFVFRVFRGLMLPEFVAQTFVVF